MSLLFLCRTINTACRRCIVVRLLLLFLTSPKNEPSHFVKKACSSRLPETAVDGHAHLTVSPTTNSTSRESFRQIVFLFSHFPHVRRGQVMYLPHGLASEKPESDLSGDLSGDLSLERPVERYCTDQPGISCVRNGNYKSSVPAFHRDKRSKNRRTRDSVRIYLVPPSSREKESHPIRACGMVWS